MMGNLTPTTNELFKGIALIIEQAKQKVAVYLNTETTLLYWNIGDFLFRELKQKNQLQYGKQIVATLSQQLSWSHLIELPSKKWFSDKLQKAIEISKSNSNSK